MTGTTNSITNAAEPDTNAILAALAAAGLTVTGHQIGADSIDIHIDGQLVSDHAATALSWRPDGHGWYLLPIDSIEGDGHASPEYLAAGTPEQIAGWLTELLDHTPAEPEQPAELTVRERLAAELHRIADDIVRLKLPLDRTQLRLGVLDSRADLERWAAYLGSEIEEDGGTANNITKTEHTIRLTDDRWGPSLQIHAQIPPDGRSEVERLRARVAELEAERAGGTR
jgi:hypothetical protein